MDDIIRKYEERDEVSYCSWPLQLLTDECRMDQLANQAPTAPVITAEAPAPESKQATTAKYEKG